MAKYATNANSDFLPTTRAHVHAPAQGRMPIDLGGWRAFEPRKLRGGGLAEKGFEGPEILLCQLPFQEGLKGLGRWVCVLCAIGRLRGSRGHVTVKTPPRQPPRLPARNQWRLCPVHRAHGLLNGGAQRRERKPVCTPVQLQVHSQMQVRVPPATSANPLRILLRPLHLRPRCPQRHRRCAAISGTAGTCSPQRWPARSSAGMWDRAK